MNFRCINFLAIKLNEDGFLQLLNWAAQPCYTRNIEGCSFRDTFEMEDILKHDIKCMGNFILVMK
jgi:hypothetical protein